MPQGQRLQFGFHVPGTLGADLNIRWTPPSNAQLVHVSAVGSNAYKAGLSIGTATNSEAYMAKKAIGASGTPAEFDFDDFATYSSKAYPRITKGTAVVLALDYDYNNGGASQASADVTIVLTLAEG